MSRLQPAEFSNLVSVHVIAILATKEKLQTFNDLFCSGEWILKDKFEDVLKGLMSIRAHCREFHAFIEQSGHLPLIVVPLRLSLLMALKDVDMQVTKLLRLLITLYKMISILRYQPIEQKLEVQQTLNDLNLHCKEVLNQVDSLKTNLRSEMNKWVRQEFCV